MKTNKFIIIFFIMQLFAFFLAATYSIILAKIFEYIAIGLELFYIVNKYKGKDSKKINYYLIFLIFVFLVYNLIQKDPSNYLELFHLAITPLFVFTYFNDNKLNKFKTLLLLQIFGFITAFFCLITKDYYFYELMIVLYPILFVNREFKVSEYLLIFITTVLLMFTGEVLIIYPMAVCLALVSVYFMYRGKSRKACSTLLILIAVLFLMTYLNISVIFLYNS